MSSSRSTLNSIAGRYRSLCLAAERQGLHVSSPLVIHGVSRHVFDLLGGPETPGPGDGSDPEIWTKRWNGITVSTSEPPVKPLRPEGVPV